MKSHPQPLRKHAPAGKAKSKRKRRPSKAFNPLEYLNSIIEELHDKGLENGSTHRKRPPSTKRDLSSALTLATPALEKTISSSKVRSKSSHSNFRKKPNCGSNPNPHQTPHNPSKSKSRGSLPSKGLLNNINFANMLSEEDSNSLIKFTEVTVQSVIHSPRIDSDNQNSHLSGE